MNVTYSPAVRASANQLRAAEQATQWLAPALGRAVNEVSAEWDREQLATHRGECLRLTLSKDNTPFRVSRAFSVDDLRDHRLMKDRFYAIIDDVYQKESHYLLEQLAIPMSEGD